MIPSRSTIASTAVQRDDGLDLAEPDPAEVVRVEREQEDRDDPRDQPADAVDRRVRRRGAVSSLVRGPLQLSVDVEQAVGDAVDVVHLLDVGTARGADLCGGAPGLSTSGRSASTSVSFVAGTIGTRMPKPSALRSTTSGLRCATTGLPSAIASSAKTPCQPAFSWSTTMSARA